MPETYYPRFLDVMHFTCMGDLYSIDETRKHFHSSQVARRCHPRKSDSVSLWMSRKRQRIQ